MNKKRKLFMCILAGVLCFSVTACSKGGTTEGGADEAHTYSFWLLQGVDSSYYLDYKENPAVQYALTKTYKGKDGKDVKIDVSFDIPATGTAKDNLNTLISTGDYDDVMDMSQYTGDIMDLYEQGMAQDLTSYVEEYMPNYMAYLDAHPDIKMLATNNVDGEKKYIKLYSNSNQLADQWSGYLYRRDWLVKYAKNPADGSSFSGEYTIKNEDGTNNMDSWVDNVVFPSGGSDPVYVSDWEWMLGIFKTAIAEEGITDGYCMSLSYAGFLATGDLTNSFGGAVGSWYKNQEGKIVYGADDDNFRLYLQVMNKWYANGWIDTAFPEHSNDMFYKIDDAKVRQGKVGLWQGIGSQMVGRIAAEDGFAKDMVVYAAKPAINDVYGTEEQMNITPFSFYQSTLEGTPIIITDKASEKDMIALCSYLDYFYSDEGMLLRSQGLSKEQYAATQDKFYTENGLTEGAYTVAEDSDGIKVLTWVKPLLEDEMLQNAAAGGRLFGLQGVPNGYLRVNPKETETYRHNINEWAVYTNTGMLGQTFIGQMDSESGKIYSKTNTNLTEFTSKSVPSFIKGDKDPNKDTDWEAYKKALSKYEPDKVTQILQDLLDSLSK